MKGHFPTSFLSALQLNAWQCNLWIHALAGHGVGLPESVKPSLRDEPRGLKEESTSHRVILLFYAILRYALPYLEPRACSRR
jgi:hypothetical protein